MMRPMTETIAGDDVSVESGRSRGDALTTIVVEGPSTGVSQNPRLSAVASKKSRFTVCRITDTDVEEKARIPGRRLSIAFDLPRSSCQHQGDDDVDFQGRRRSMSDSTHAKLEHPNSSGGKSNAGAAATYGACNETSKQRFPECSQQPWNQNPLSPRDEPDLEPRRRRSSSVSLTGKVPQLYLSLLSANNDNQASIGASTLSLNQATVVSTIGDLPMFPNTYGVNHGRFRYQRGQSVISNRTLSRPPSYDGSMEYSSYYDSGPSGPAGSRSLAGDSFSQYDVYNNRKEGEEKFEISWDAFQDTFMNLRGRLTKHGGFYNVASTYFLFTYSGHGFKHWFLPMGFVRKGFWVGLVLVFVYAMIVQSIQTVQNYFTYPKSVSVYVVDEEKADFPAVTVCNFNMLSKSRLSYQAQHDRANFPKRLEDALNLQKRFERILKKGDNGKMDYQSICTEGYLHWQSPSSKAAPPQQIWPHSNEEKLWDHLVLEQRKERMKAAVQDRPFPHLDDDAHPFAKVDSVMVGQGPCDQMVHYGVDKGFRVEQRKIKLWELEVGYNFSGEYALPDPRDVFKCSPDGKTLLEFNDTALAEICRKALYDPTSNRPCLSSYFQSNGVPLNVTCFTLNRICDGSPDCGLHDDTDETLYCDDTTGKATCDKVNNLNACDDGHCYESSLHCDGFQDCADGTDEKNCAGLKFDKSCGCYVICNSTTADGKEECFPLSPFDGVYDGNVEKVMWRSKTPADFNTIASLLAPSPEEIRKFGVRAQDFIVSCSFDGAPCSYKNFFKWQNEEFGNCFTFNSPLLANVSKRDDKVYRTTKHGYRNGLRLTLNVEIDDYLAAVTPIQGARMVIHDRREIPFPAENGIDLSPLFETAIVVERTHIERVPYPHGNCNRTNEELWEHHFKVRYSSLACTEVCRESLIRRRCGCSASLNPVFKKDQQQSCSLSNRTQRACMDDAMQSFQQGDSERGEAGAGCQKCAPGCDEWLFKSTTSGTVKNKMFQFIFSSINKIFLTDDFCSGIESPDESGTVHAHVYLDTLSHEHIVESPAYSFQQFVSNVGGIWGLFAGFSIITFIEWIEITINVLLHLCRRTWNRLKANEKLQQDQNEERSTKNHKLEDRENTYSTRNRRF